MGGTDAASFDIVAASGRIRTKEGVTYDHEDKSSYSVTVTATDTNNATDTATVAITVTDVAEPPLPPPLPPPLVVTCPPQNWSKTDVSLGPQRRAKWPEGDTRRSR